ncbi:MAG: hypothetical protein KAI82_01810 [Tritonibacter mobilis]|jgi:hypothetical protein|uniref:hypothetical protein n=1 Tax=Halopseudomonas sp. TaxID=2901191 RepID=UPI00300398AE|nr:hypothetical protein [Tritonibacter mobilis]|tara:strand:- start:1326 stop:1514 length:189 start_codon:yes stop_codon:yes gene_type:complete
MNRPIFRELQERHAQQDLKLEQVQAVGYSAFRECAEYQNRLESRKADIKHFFQNNESQLALL